MQLDTERTEYLDFTLPEIRRHIKRFKHLDYTITANRQALVDTFVDKVWLYDDRNAKIRYKVTDFHKGSFLERLVPEVGLEPTRGRPHWILSPARLPFHHSGGKITLRFRLL